MKKIKAVVLVLIMILCGAAFARGMQVEAKANAVQEKLSGEVFRFHVLANSDSKEDQELKMKVKEAVVDYMCENLSNAGSVLLCGESMGDPPQRRTDPDGQGSLAERRM